MRDNIWTDISVIRMKLLSDTEYDPASNKLYSPVVRFMKDYTENRALRLEMLRTITGIPQLTSTKQLTAKCCMILIEEWKSDDSWKPNRSADKLLTALASYVEECPDYGQREADYKGWLAYNGLYDLQ